MHVRYKNTFIDALAFATVQNLRSVSLLGFALLLGALLAWAFIPDDVQGFAAAGTFAVMCLLYFIILLAFQLLFNAYWFALNRDRNFLTEHTSELTQTSFIDSTEHTRIEIKWAGIFTIYSHLNML